MGALPDWARPEAYHLALKVDPHKDSFGGSVAIDVDLRQASRYLWLHGHSVDVSAVTVLDAAGHRRPARYVVADADVGIARIDFDRELKAQHLRLELTYTAPFNGELQGLYKVEHDGAPYVITQMEPVSARYAFPAFDQPSFKTPFDLTLTVPADETAVANAAQIREEKADPGWKTVVFAQTRPLPTYLVAFAVGPWDVATGPSVAPTQGRASPLSIRGIAVKGEGHRLGWVLGETPRIVSYLENYYGFAYPYGKLDLLAAPDFSAGAMENAGLITYRDFLMLLDPDAPLRSFRESFITNAHELAHQWTGDIVTLNWWDDVWLNEGFATWMQYKVTHAIHPEYNTELDRVGDIERAMDADAQVSAREIRQPITGNGDIQTAFDAISYMKSGAVIAMMEAYVGEDVFQRGMREYIHAHAFGNASAPDLIDSIATAAGQGDAFRHAFASFLNQTGTPYIGVSLTPVSGGMEAHLAQSRYLPAGSKGDAARVWGVPVCIRYGLDDGSSKVACKLLDSTRGSLVLQGATSESWVMPNANASGYYRFALDGPDLARLAAAVGHLSDAEQLAYADTVGAAFDRGDINAQDLLVAYEPLTHSKIGRVLLAPFPRIGWMLSYEAKTDAQRQVLREWVTTHYGPALARLGFTKRAGESIEDTQTRAKLVEQLADINIASPDARKAMLAAGDKILRLKDGKLDFEAVDADLRTVALRTAVEERGKAAVDILLPQLATTTDPTTRVSILNAVGAVQDGAQADRVHDAAVGKTIKVGEMFRTMVAARSTQNSRDQLWRWFGTHADAVSARAGSFGSGFVPQFASTGGCSRQDADRLTTFFAPRLSKVAGLDRGLSQAVEAIELCTALREKQDPSVLATR